MPHEQSPAVWDGIAARYDGLRPDQGLTDPDVREAWQSLLSRLLPKGRVLDVGCGTGSLSLLLAGKGHGVTGIDFSPAMIEQATQKAVTMGAAATFLVQDASDPKFPAGSFDAIICRQVLWALADQRAVLRNWANLLREGGRLILVEGLFASGNGIAMTDVLAAMPEDLVVDETTDLSGEASLWGGLISDQRYLVAATRRSS